MPTTKTGYWIRVENDQVKDVWDYRPTTGPKADLPGWREAVEIFPDVTDGREIITTHAIDITKTPAEIVWSKRELTVDERKDGLKAQAKRTFQEVVDTELAKELDDDPNSTYDADAVSTAQSTYQSALTAINALTTHDEVDAYGA